jgi:hypothetical protein
MDNETGRYRKNKVIRWRKLCEALETHSKLLSAKQTINKTPGRIEKHTRMLM